VKTLKLFFYFKKGGPGDLRDPDNFALSYYGPPGDSQRIAVEIKKLNSTDTGFNKYQAILKDFINGMESLQCNYNILSYGK